MESDFEIQNDRDFNLMDNFGSIIYSRLQDRILCVIPIKYATCVF